MLTPELFDAVVLKRRREGAHGGVGEVEQRAAPFLCQARRTASV